MKIKSVFVLLFLSAVSAFPVGSWAISPATDKAAIPPAVSSSTWTAGARLHRGLGSVTGSLQFNARGIEFQSPKIPSLHWTFVEIKSLDLFPRQVILTTYDKRGRFRPGSRRFHFTLGAAMPPTVATALAQHLGRPSRNADPDLSAPTIATIPARHRTAFGGTRSNGVLRFGDAGIEYVTPTQKDSRSWRWADIQTVSSRDAYHFTVFGYRDTYSFDLKQPITRGLLNRLADQIYRHQPLNGGSARYSEQ